jgi:plasmid stabilization system protein ParE
MSNIIWSPKAVSQLDNIFNYINKDSKIYSKIVVQQIISFVEKFSINPKSGRIMIEFSDQEILERRYGNYRIMYRIRNEDIIFD